MVAKEKMPKNTIKERAKGLAKTLEEAAYGTPRLLNPSSCDET